MKISNLNVGGSIALLLLAGGQVLGTGAPEAVLTPGLLAQGYGVEMRVLDDPEAGLLILPMR